MAEKAKQVSGASAGKTGSVVSWVVATIVVIVFYESLVLFVIGMAPTFVALFADRQRFAARAVAYLNFAGCLPFALDYWMGSGGFDRVFQIVGDPFALFVIYACAAAGWGLYFVTRPFAGAYLLVSADYRETRLKRKQEDLVEKWGEDVAPQDDDGQKPAAAAPAARDTPA
jgi:hypothetical protein